MKINEHDAGHMTKMAAKPIYGKNPNRNCLVQSRSDSDVYAA